MAKRKPQAATFFGEPLGLTSVGLSRHIFETKPTGPFGLRCRLTPPSTWGPFPKGWTALLMSHTREVVGCVNHDPHGALRALELTVTALRDELGELEGES